MTTGVILPAVNPETTAQTAVGREQCTATYLLTNSPRGKSIIDHYNASELKFLTRKDRIAITNIVVDEFFYRFSKLTPSELKQRAEELFKLFPDVPEVNFFFDS